VRQHRPHSPFPSISLLYSFLCIIRIMYVRETRDTTVYVPNQSIMRCAVYSSILSDYSRPFFQRYFLMAETREQGLLVGVPLNSSVLSRFDSSDILNISLSQTAYLFSSYLTFSICYTYIHNSSVSLPLVQAPTKAHSTE
jgi:hypothetical protein